MVCVSTISVFGFFGSTFPNSLRAMPGLKSLVSFESITNCSTFPSGTHSDLGVRLDDQRLRVFRIDLSELLAGNAGIEEFGFLRVDHELLHLPLGNAFRSGCASRRSASSGFSDRPFRTPCGQCRD